jgi:hypothetical protein
MDYRNKLKVSSVDAVWAQTAEILSGNVHTRGKLNRPITTVRLGSLLTLGIFLGLGSIGDSHSGIVDGYGCHRGSDKVSYHCHQGQFAGRTFKSKEDFLRDLRGGKSAQLSPKKNPPQPQRKLED